MKTLLLALVGLAFLGPQSLQNTAVDPTGIWRVEFVGPLGDRPRTVTGILLELFTEGSKVSGVVHMHNWPDCAYISQGTVEGNRVSFVANGRSPWNSDTLTGYPR